MKKILFLVVIFCMAIVERGNSQNGGYITGVTDVAPGSTETYSVSFDITTYDVVYEVVGGTVINSDYNYITVQWDNVTGFYGYIEVWDVNSFQEGILNISIGAGTPYVTPVYQTLHFGETPLPLEILWTSPPSPSSISYQWYTGSGTEINGATSSTYTPPIQTEYTQSYYCIITAYGFPFYSDICYISMTEFTAGSISFYQQPQYHDYVQINSTPPDGGPCNNYEYAWEQSYDGFYWTVIGTTEIYPSNSYIIHDRCFIRRKVTCGVQVLFSNTLEITPIYAPDDVENNTYIKETVVLVKNSKSLKSADALPIGKKFKTATYLDGLGRPIQKVEKGVSLNSQGNWNDWVTPIEYDNLGRTPKSFLPYSASNEIGKFKPDAATSQAAYILQKYSDTKGYGQVNYDNSPLSRVVKTFGPGADWVDSKGISYEYDFNTGDENVRIWNIGFTGGAIPESGINEVYTSGTLNKKITFDENNKKVVEYSDFSGNLILKKVQDKEGQALTEQHAGWSCTYYVYNDFNKLQFIIPPKAVEWLDLNNWDLASNMSLVNHLCYWYEYDKYGRVIAKKSPNADPVYMVYDTKDRLVFTQNGRQRSGKWMVTLYDVLNREVVTGEITYTGSREDLQQYMNSIIYDGTVPQSIVTSGGLTTFVNVNVNLNPITSAHSLYIHTITYYDKYNYPLAKSFSTNFQIDNTVTADEYEAVTTSDRTTNAITGTFVRILDGSNKFLLTTTFYDDKLRPIQVQAENILGNTDISTAQYDFSGKKRSSFISHSAKLQISPTVVSAQIEIFNKSYFDKIGRVIKISEKINNNIEKDLAEYKYSENGQMVKKRLAPGFTGEDGPELETLEYEHNIRGWLTGINKSYANSIDQQGRYFGMEFGYSQMGTNFTKVEWNGNISGIKWKSRGNNIQRRYEYEYDNLGQVKQAVFRQKNTSGSNWSNDKADFTTQVEYFSNGNISSLNQWGIVPGMGVTQIDQLVYSYDNNGYSNKLLRVDEGITGAWNGKLGDFRNGSNGNGVTDYIYDVDGNLVKDLNKDIDGITTGTDGIEYNILNLPSKIAFKNSGKTITYTYDATGNKLKKILNEPGPNNSTSIIETDYVGDFIYEGRQSEGHLFEGVILQFFSHTEGRVRVITPASENNGLSYLNGGISLPGGKQGVYDYYIKDHLSNIRMILTEEQLQTYEKATMEDNNSTREEAVFGQQTASNEVKETRSDVYPGWTSNISLRVSKLSSLTGGKKIGPNALIRVMAGDVVSAKTLYYYETPINSGSSILNEIVSSIIGSVLSPTKTNDLIKGNYNLIKTNLESPAGPLGNFIMQQPNGAVVNQPKAFVTVLFFDEQFNFVSDNSGSMPVEAAGMIGSGQNAISRDISIIRQAPQNGYAIVYISNESPVNVYFDDFEVTHTRGRIIEEDHYYTYGLKIAGISGKAGSSGFPDGAQTNSRVTYGFQGDFSEEDVDAQWNEFAYRTYDPQIGRWLQVDPEDIFASPYIGMGNNPVSSIDPLGTTPYDWYRNAAGTMFWCSSTASSIIDDLGVTWDRVGSDFYIPSTAGDDVGYDHYMAGKIGFVTNAEYAALHMTFEDKFRIYVNSTGAQGFGAGAGYGIVKAVWGTIKSMATIAYATAPGAGFAPRNFMDDEVSKMNQGLRQLVVQSIEAGHFNPAQTMVENYVKGVYNAYANGDAFDASVQTGELTFDIVSLLYGGEGLIGKPATIGGKLGGRLGNATTRLQIAEVATELESRGYTITKGGGRFAEEYLKPIGGGRKGGSYLDLTATHPDYGTLRINTVDVYKNGLPTTRELNNAARIRKQIAPGEHLLLIPKKVKL